MKAANGVAASPRHELMQTREQTEMLIAMRIAELRHLALLTSEACAALGLGKKMPPDEHARLRETLLRYLKDARPAQ